MPSPLSQIAQIDSSDPESISGLWHEWGDPAQAHGMTNWRNRIEYLGPRHEHGFQILRLASGEFFHFQLGENPKSWPKVGELAGRFKLHSLRPLSQGLSHTYSRG